MVSMKDSRQHAVEQAVSVGAEGGVVPDLLVHAQANKPAIQQVVFEVANQGALGADRVQRLDQAGAQQALGGNGITPRRGVDRIQFLVHLSQEPVHYRPKLGAGGVSWESVPPASDS